MNAEAPIDGSLSMCHVNDGDIVAEGQRIAEIECMKTYYEVTAPCAGKVRFKVDLGEVVAQGETIAEIISE